MHSHTRPRNTPLAAPLALALPLALSLALPLALLPSCSNPIDTSPNLLPSAEGGVSAGAAAGSVAGSVAGAAAGAQAGVAAGGPCESCPSVGDWYRFSALSVVSLDGNPSHGSIGVLNNLWRADIAGSLLNVMFEVVEVTPDQLVVRALNAARLADVSMAEEGRGYCLLPETAIEFRFAREGCGFTNPEASGINIYSGRTDIPKNCSPTLSAPNTIPVRGVTLTGDFNPTCGKIIGGRVPSASIPRSALTATCSCLSPVVESCGGLNPEYMGNTSGECAGCGPIYTSLNTQLSLFGPLSYGCSADGEDAVCLEASWEAERLDFTPSVCD